MIFKIILVFIGDYYMVDGGFYISGKEFFPINESEICNVAARIKKSGVKNVVIAGKFQFERVFTLFKLYLSTPMLLCKLA